MTVCGGKPLRVNEKVVLTELADGSGVLLHLETKFYYTLNSTGVFVWKSLAQKTAHTAPDLGAGLARTYAVSEEQARVDAQRLLEEMAVEELVFYD